MLFDLYVDEVKQDGHEGYLFFKPSLSSSPKRSRPGWYKALENIHALLPIEKQSNGLTELENRMNKMKMKSKKSIFYYQLKYSPSPRRTLSPTKHDILSTRNNDNPLAKYTPTWNPHGKEVSRTNFSRLPKFWVWGNSLLMTLTFDDIEKQIDAYIKKEIDDCLRSIHQYETDSDADDDDVISNDSFYSCEGDDEEVMLRFDDDEEIDADIIDLDNFVCKICMEPKAGHEWFDMIKNCNHAYCRDCMVNYVASKLQENIAIIRCPDPDCESGSLEPENCDWLLPQEVFEKWGKALCEAAVPSSQKFYCPFKDCSAMLIADHGSKDVRQSKCPYCRRFFCAQCKVPWHVMDCSKFQKLSKHVKGREDIMLRELARSKAWMRCPNCRFYVEKNQGCQFVLCRCGAEFCYKCGIRPADRAAHRCTRKRRSLWSVFPPIYKS